MVLQYYQMDIHQSVVDIHQVDKDIIVVVVVIIVIQDIYQVNFYQMWMVVII